MSSSATTERLIIVIAFSLVFLFCFFSFRLQMKKILKPILKELYRLMIWYYNPCWFYMTKQEPTARQIARIRFLFIVMISLRVDELIKRFVMPFSFVGLFRMLTIARRGSLRFGITGFISTALLIPAAVIYPLNQLTKRLPLTQKCAVITRKARRDDTRVRARVLIFISGELFKKRALCVWMPQMGLPIPGDFSRLGNRNLNI